MALDIRSCIISYCKESFNLIHDSFSSTSNEYDSLCVVCHKRKFHKLHFLFPYTKLLNFILTFGCHPWLSQIVISITFISLLLSLDLHWYIFWKINFLFIKHLFSSKLNNYFKQIVKLKFLKVIMVKYSVTYIFV